jgi:hypothetical protein
LALPTWDGERDGPNKRKRQTAPQPAPARNGHAAATVVAGPPVQLFGERSLPRLLGVETDRLTAAEYCVVQALVEAQAPLPKDQLDLRSGRTGTPMILNRLCKKSPAWAKVIYLPGAKRDGYRLRSRDELVN